MRPLRLVAVRALLEPREAEGEVRARRPVARARPVRLGTPMVGLVLLSMRHAGGGPRSVRDAGVRGRASTPRRGEPVAESTPVSSVAVDPERQERLEPWVDVGLLVVVRAAAQSLAAHRRTALGSPARTAARSARRAGSPRATSGSSRARDGRSGGRSGSSTESSAGPSRCRRRQRLLVDLELEGHSMSPEAAAALPAMAVSSRPSTNTPRFVRLDPDVALDRIGASSRSSRASSVDAVDRRSRACVPAARASRPASGVGQRARGGLGSSPRRSPPRPPPDRPAPRQAVVRLRSSRRLAGWSSARRSSSSGCPS